MKKIVTDAGKPAHPIVVEPALFSILDDRWFSWRDFPKELHDKPEIFVVHHKKLFWLRDMDRRHLWFVSGRVVQITGEDYARRCLLDAMERKEKGYAL